MTVCTMGDIILRLSYLSGRCYVERIQGYEHRLVYFGNMRECMTFIESVHAIYIESQCAITI